MPRSISVFGSTGFVGSAVAELARDRGWDLVRAESPAGHRLDVSRASSALQDAAGASDVIVNCVGRAHVRSNDPAVYWPGNVAGAQVVAEAAARSSRTRRLVHVSSVAVGAAGLLPHAGPSLPSSTYGMTKAAGELLVESIGRAHDLDVVVVRPVGVYGRTAPGEWGRIWRMVEAGRTIPVPSPGGLHDIVSIEAVGAFLLDGAGGGIDPGVYNLTGPMPMSVQDYVRLVGREVGTRARSVAVPRALLRAGVRATGGVGRIADRLTAVHQALGTLETPPRPLADGPGLVRLDGPRRHPGLTSA